MSTRAVTFDGREAEYDRAEDKIAREFARAAAPGTTHATELRLIHALKAEFPGAKLEEEPTR